MPARKSTNDGNEPEKNTLKGYAKYAKGLWIWSNKFTVSG